MANPWQPGYTCPYTLIGLSTGDTIEVKTVQGQNWIGTVYAMSQLGFVLDIPPNRVFIPTTRIAALVFTIV